MEIDSTITINDGKQVMPAGEENVMKSSGKNEDEIDEHLKTFKALKEHMDYNGELMLGTY
jgi:hypothetical protein